jgi:hypothetical protein
VAPQATRPRVLEPGPRRRARLTSPDAAPVPGERCRHRRRVFANRNHPNGGVLNYRIERGGRAVVLATDVGPRARRGSRGLRADADLLVHDAQYTDEVREVHRGRALTWRADVAQRNVRASSAPPRSSPTILQSRTRAVAREKFPARSPREDSDHDSWPPSRRHGVGRHQPHRSRRGALWQSFSPARARRASACWLTATSPHALARPSRDST